MLKSRQGNLFIVAGILLLVLLGTAGAYAQIPDPKTQHFPIGGNRAAVWVVAQLHILFAAFILGAPIFVVVSEILGWRSGNPRYERLAKEVTKVTVILYSMTALTGGLFIFVLLATHPQLTSWLINHFFAVFAWIYPLLFIAETIILYLYWYTWDTLQGPRKRRHIVLGIVLNVIGTVTLIVIDGPTAFMNTPVKSAEGLDLKTFIETTATLWDKMNNYSWWPLNLHRFIGNVTFGGFIAGLIAAYMYLLSKTDEDRAFYDWFGFVGNMIGVGTSLLLPFAGYLLSYELCDYDASICPYMMADQLSMFFEMQGVMVGLIFLASNYYIWLSMKRIEGLEQVRMSIATLGLMVTIPVVFMLVWTRYPIPDIMALIIPVAYVAGGMLLGRFLKWTVSAQTLVKVAFLMVVIGNAIWMTPHAFVATQALAPDDGSLSLLHGELNLGFVTVSWGDLALMPAKNAAAFTLVFVTICNYIMYGRAVRKGRIAWGKIDVVSQFVLVFLAFSAIWTMGLMGEVRELTRKYFHVFNLLYDFTPESFTPTLAYSSWVITGVTLTFYIIVSFAIILTLRTGKEKTPAESPEGMPAPVGVESRERAVAAQRSFFRVVIKRGLQGVIAAGVLFVATRFVFDFPPVYQNMFVCYGLFGAFVLLLLDTPSMPLLKRFTAITALVAFYCVIAGAFVAGANMWPQYDPTVEKGKIDKIVKPKLGVTDKARIEELLKRNEELTAQNQALIQQVEDIGRGRKVKPVERRTVGAGPAALPAVAGGDLIALGKEQYELQECYNCHKIGGKGSVKKRGPVLDNIGNLMKPEELKQKILDPQSWMTEGFEKEYNKKQMPDKYRELMSEAEIDALVAYLSSLKDPSVETPKSVKKL